MGIQISYGSPKLKGCCLVLEKAEQVYGRTLADRLTTAIAEAEAFDNAEQWRDFLGEDMVSTATKSFQVSFGSVYVRILRGNRQLSDGQCLRTRGLVYGRVFEADGNFGTTMMDERSTPDWFSKPGDSIRAVMKKRGIAAADLARHLDGGMVRVRTLLDGTGSIDEDTAVELTSVLGANTKFWLKRQENFDAAVDRAVQRICAEEDEDVILSIPAPGPKPKGKLSAESKAEEVRRRLIHFNVPTINSWTSRYGRLVSHTDFRKSNTFSSHDDATLLWLRRGELESDMINTRAWEPGNLEDRITAIRKLSQVRHPQSFLPKLRELCAEAGVALVVVKAPKGCRASGAARMVDPDKAMLLLSFPLSDRRPVLVHRLSRDWPPSAAQSPHLPRQRRDTLR